MQNARTHRARANTSPAAQTRWPRLQERASAVRGAGPGGKLEKTSIGRPTAGRVKCEARGEAACLAGHEEDEACDLLERPRALHRDLVGHVLDLVIGHRGHHRRAHNGGRDGVARDVAALSILPSQPRESNAGGSEGRHMRLQTLRRVRPTADAATARPPTSFPMDLVSPITAALDAEYASMPALPSLPATDAILTMRP